MLNGILTRKFSELISLQLFFADSPRHYWCELKSEFALFLTEFISLNGKVLPVIESYSYILCSNY